MGKEASVFDYDRIGINYSSKRRTDPRIAAFVEEALGDTKTVINVGAGAGSYESNSRYFAAVEPSAVMRTQRLENGRVPAIDAFADNLPFDDNSFDAAMAMVTIHHWPDVNAGIKELLRVSKGRVVILTMDPGRFDDFWFSEYFPELLDREKHRFPSRSALREMLGENTKFKYVPVNQDCVDGFIEAYFSRPEAFLDKKVRDSQSGWKLFTPEEEKNRLSQFGSELADGTWDRKYGHYRTMKEFTGSLMLAIKS